MHASVEIKLRSTIRMAARGRPKGGAYHPIIRAYWRNMKQKAKEESYEA
jgi:hypothetical protein